MSIFPRFDEYLIFPSLKCPQIPKGQQTQWRSPAFQRKHSHGLLSPWGWTCERCRPLLPSAASLGPGNRTAPHTGRGSWSTSPKRGRESQVHHSVLPWIPCEASHMEGEAPSHTQTTDQSWFAPRICELFQRREEIIFPQSCRMITALMTGVDQGVFKNTSDFVCNISLLCRLDVVLWCMTHCLDPESKMLMWFLPNVRTSLLFSWFSWSLWMLHDFHNTDEIQK